MSKVDPMTTQNEPGAGSAGSTKADGPAFYARFVEFGTSKMAARPFMRPAFEKSASAAIDAVKAGLEKAIERAAKR